MIPGRRAARTIILPMAALLLLLTLCGSGAAAQGPLVLPAPEFESDYQRPEMSFPAADGVRHDVIYIRLLVLLIVLAVWLIHYRRTRRGVAALSVFSLILLGFWMLGCICPIGAVQNVARGIADPAAVLPWAAVIVFALPLVVALFYGRVFCGGVCPLGAIQDAVLLRPVRVPDWLDKPLSLVPLVYLGLAVMVAALGGPFLICQYDPFIGLFRLSGEVWLIAAGLGLLAVGLFVARPYCRFLCPYGVLLGFCSSVTRKRMSTCPTDCINCRLCEKACPTGAIRPPTEEQGDPVEHRPHRAAWFLVLTPLVLAAAGWVAGPAAARLHPTIHLWRLVEQDLRQPADERPKELEAFYASPGNTPEALEAEVATLFSRFRWGSAAAGAFVGLAIAVQAVIQLRRPVRYRFSVNQRTCLACSRCIEYCPLEQARRRQRRGLRPAADAPPVAATPGHELQPQPAAPRAALAGRLALISGLFSAAVAISLLVIWASAQHYPLEEWPEMQALQQARADAPADTSITDEIRNLDAAYRSHYLRRQHLLQSGALLLAAGLLATLALLRWRAALRPAATPLPDGGPEFMDRSVVAHHRAAGGVLAFGGVVLAALLTVGLVLPEVRRARVDAAMEEAAVPPNWPRFRGPTGDGHVHESGDWPAWWDGASGAGIRWKQQLPLEGKSSPIVWGDRVFVTAADQQASLLLCFSAETGEPLWSRQVQPPPRTTTEAGDPPDEGYTGWAAPTPATDGQLVFATYANADIVCFDFDGKQRWARNYGPARSPWGLATSLVLWKNLVIWQIDQGKNPDENLSQLVALDKRSGREVWRVARPTAGSWTTPIIVEAERAGVPHDLLVTTGDPLVIAYDPATGNELWRGGNVGVDVAPSPVAAARRVIAAGENEAAFALRLGGSGDISETHTDWQIQSALPATVSPLATDEYTLLVTDQGAVTCLRTETGETVWQQELEQAAQPSPCLVGDVVYLMMADGTMFRFRLGEKFELLNRSELNEKTAASPAFSGGRIFIRGAKHLYCIDGAEQPAAAAAPEETSPPEGATQSEETTPPKSPTETFAPPSDDIFGN